MVRTVFFSFNFERDHWRAGQVRSAWVTKDDREDAGYVDGATWEEVKSKTDAAIRRWINRQMKGCSVTAVLIGSETYDRKWINYEIEKSVKEGMGLVGIRVHRMKDKNGNRDSKGKNPLSMYNLKSSGERLDSVYNTYDWVSDDGRENIGDWVEEAARIANR